MKFRKILACVLSVCVCFLFVSCGSDTNNTTASTSSAQSSTAGESDEVTVQETQVHDGTIDVDLTALSSTMVYSEVYNMLYSPEDYIGKVVRMSGSFAIYTSESTGTNYFAVLIDDATACCQQGMEFIWVGDHTYPDDYPELGTQVEVTGEFQTYLENGVTYCHLISDDVVF